MLVSNFFFDTVTISTICFIMFSFLLTSISAVNSVDYCLYSTNSNKCSGFPAENSYDEANFTKMIKKQSEKTKQFNGYIRVAINIVENLTKTKLDLFLMKNAHHIYILGPENTYAEYILNVNEVTTLENLTISNSYIKKDNSTSFYMENLTLTNVQWYGFSKASTFFGGILETDLHSIEGCNFKFDSVIYHVGCTTNFSTIREVNGAVFTKNVEFKDFNNESALYQYGRDFIIHPKPDFGLVRTNFRSIDENNITFKITHTIPNTILTLACYFSNREAVFVNTSVYTDSNTLVILGYKWNGYESINLHARNSTIEVNKTEDYTLDMFISEAVDTTFNLYGKTYYFRFINTEYLHNVVFNAKTVEIFDIYVNDGTNPNIKANQLKVRRFTSRHGEDVDFEGINLIVENISESVRSIKVDELYINNSIKFDMNDEYIPCIIAKEVTTTDSIFIWIRKNYSFKSGESDVLPLIKSSKELPKTFQDYAMDLELPFKLTKQTNLIGVTYSDLFKYNVNNFCLSNSTSAWCSENATTVNSSSLEELVKFIGVPEQYFELITLNVYLDNYGTDNVFLVKSDFYIQRVLINGQSPEMKSKAHLASPRGKFYHLKFQNIGLTAVEEEPNITVFSLHDADLPDYYKNKVTLKDVESLYVQGSTFEQFHLSSSIIRPIRLIIYSKYINFTKDYIIPDVPYNNITQVIIREVESVNGKGAYPDPLKIWIEHTHNSLLVDENGRTAIRFTTNTYGNLSFALTSWHETDVYYKAVLPVDLYDGSDNTQYHLHPKFLGIKVETYNKFCTKNFTIDLTPDQTVLFKYDNLLCTDVSHISIPSEITMKDSFVSGVKTLERFTVERKLYLEKDTYMRSKQFGNPNDDFLLYFNWSLSKMPYFRIDDYDTDHAKVFTPAIETYAYPNPEEEEFIKANRRIYDFGIPFFCVLSSQYKGNVMFEGLLFNRPNVTTTTATKFNRIGLESNSDMCAYLIPLEDNIAPHVRRGPDNPVPYIIIIAVSFVLLLALIITFVYSMFCKRHKKVIANSDVQVDLIHQDLLSESAGI